MYSLPLSDMKVLTLSPVWFSAQLIYCLIKSTTISLERNVNNEQFRENSSIKVMKYLLPSKSGSNGPHTSECILPSTSEVEGGASRKVFLFAFEVRQISQLVFGDSQII